MADEPEKARALMLPYWCALGEFLDHFAMTEMLLKLVIGKDTGLSVDATRILLQGTRANDVAGYLSRLNELGVLEPLDRWVAAEALIRFQSLNSMRNDLVHFGTDRTRLPTTPEMQISNRFLARTPAQLKEFSITAQTLLDMCHDITKISYIFGIHLTGDGPDAPAYKAGERFLHAAWRYTPPQLEGQLRKSREGFHRQRPPPEAS